MADDDIPSISSDHHSDDELSIASESSVQDAEGVQTAGHWIPASTASTSNGTTTTPPMLEVFLPEPPPKPDSDEKRSSHSIAHSFIEDKQVVLFHLDVETAGAKVGMVQLSVVAVELHSNTTLGEFDKYIKPTARAEDWSDEAMAIHGIYPNQDTIQNASQITTVWREFVHFVESKLDSGNKRGIFVAWNGKACDMEELFKVTCISHRGQCIMPRWVPFFMDPMAVIQHYKSCKLNEKHTKLVGYGLQVIWCYVKNATSLTGAHSSIIDARAQAEIVSAVWSHVCRQDGVNCVSCGPLVVKDKQSTQKGSGAKEASPTWLGGRYKQAVGASVSKTILWTEWWP